MSGGEAMFRPPSLHLQISLGKELSSFTGGVGGGGAQNLLPSVPSSVPALPLRRPGHDEADASDRRSRERQGKAALCLPPRRPDSGRRHGARQPARIKIAFIRKWREALKSTSSLGSSDQRKVACFDKGNHNERDVPPSPAIKECALFPI